MKTYQLVPLVAPLGLLAASAFLTPRAVASDPRTAAIVVNAPISRTLTGLVWKVGKNHGKYLTGPEIETVLEGNPPKVVENYVRGHGEYWELWDVNGRDPVICQWLLDEIARARMALPRNEIPNR